MIEVFHSYVKECDAIQTNVNILAFWRYLLDLVLKRVTRVSNCMKLSKF